MIWVVDANDTARMTEARSELDELMKEAKLKNVPMLVLANKSDLVMAKDADEIADLMKLKEITGREIKCVSVSAKTGDGLQDAFDWAVDILQKNKKK